MFWFHMGGDHGKGGSQDAKIVGIADQRGDIRELIQRKNEIT